MSFKVCLINPLPTRFPVIDICEPLSLISLGTYLHNAGVQVKIVDESIGEDAILEVQAFEPNLVGFTATTYAYPRAVVLANQVKQKGYRTVIGGVHASALPGLAYQDGFDMVVVGEGEKMLLEIVEKEYRKGIFKPSSDMILKEEEIPFLDKTLINLDIYSRFFKNSVLRGGVLGTHLLGMRGCPYTCIFCYNSGRQYPVRILNATRIFAEVEEIIKISSIRHIDFQDDDFFICKKRIKEFCQLEIKKKLGFTWSCAARSSSVDEETIGLAAASGCRRIGFGFESGSQRILDRMEKSLSVEQNMAAARLCHKYKIEIHAYITVGNPGEQEEDLRLTREFIKKAYPGFASPTRLCPYPGTALWKWCQDEGYINNIEFKNLSYRHADIQIPGTFTPEKVGKIRIKLFLWSCLILPRMRRRLMVALFRQLSVTFMFLMRRLSYKIKQN